MVTIKFKTDNAAFSDGNEGDEAARILRNIADIFGHAGIGLNDAGRIFDSNGNCVGEWESKSEQ